MSKLFLKSAMAVQQHAIERIKQLERALPSIERLEDLAAIVQRQGFQCTPSIDLYGQGMKLTVPPESLEQVIKVINFACYSVVRSDTLLILPNADCKEDLPHTFALEVFE
jgi:hypothetical protein